MPSFMHCRLLRNGNHTLHQKSWSGPSNFIFFLGGGRTPRLPVVAPLLPLYSGAKYCDERVYLYVCLSARVSQTRRVRTSRNFLNMLPLAMVRSFSDDNAICMYFRFVDDVVFVHNEALWAKIKLTSYNLMSFVRGLQQCVHVHCEETTH